MVKCLPLDYMTFNNIPVVFRFLQIIVIYYEVIGLCIVILGSRGEKRTIRYSKLSLSIFLCHMKLFSYIKLDVLVYISFYLFLLYKQIIKVTWLKTPQANNSNNNSFVLRL